MQRRPLTILNVEDDAEIREIVALSLRLDDAISLQSAADGGEALRMLIDAARVPDCILLDVRLPDIDGRMVLAEIRALPGMAEVPVIYMTAALIAHDEVVFGGDGAIGTIAKPFNPLSLATEIRAMLAGAE